MNRCPKSPVTPFFIAACALLVGASMVFHQEARAERGFPLKTERAEMKFIELPDVLLNGKPERLAHAVRVRDERNAIVMPGTVNEVSATLVASTMRGRPCGWNTRFCSAADSRAYSGRISVFGG